MNQRLGLFLQGNLVADMHSDISDVKFLSSPFLGAIYCCFLCSFCHIFCQMRMSSADGFGISVSSSLSCSSQGSGPYDIESLGDIYVGEDLV